MSAKFVWLSAVVLGLAGCGGLANVEVNQKVAQEYATGTVPRIVVETFNGNVEVQRGMDKHVDVVVTKVGSGWNEAEAKEDLANIQVTMTQDQDVVRVTARQVVQRNGNSRASVHLTVPAASSLDLTTSNGELTSDQIVGAQELKTTNGRIRVAAGSGALKARTSNGQVELEAQHAMVDAHSSNGAIVFRGSLASGDHVFETSNGAIAITLPQDATFAIDASTSNGSVTSDFDLQAHEPKQREILQGSTGGNPTTKIRAGTNNGSIEIRRAR